MRPINVLSDGSIRRLVDEGRLTIDPWDPEMVQPASVDLKLGPTFRVFHNHRIQTIDLADPPRDLTEQVAVGEDGTFVIHPGEFVLGRTEEWVELPEDLVARIEGKALALDTKVPTPDGWRTMGELNVGDHVFGPDGVPLPVIAATPSMEGRPCREIEFSDGTTVTADAEHQWEVQTKADRMHRHHRKGAPLSVLSSREMEDSLRVPWAPGEYAYHVPLAQPVQYPDKELPIDPYVLGVWLGDGTTTAAIVTSKDQPILRELELAGYSVRRASGPIAYVVGGEGHTRDGITGRYMRNGSFSSRLRNLGLLGDKHIPTNYMQASVAQRRALLQGLMDTDGYVDKQGRCELTTVKPRLAQQYREIVASLGFRPVIAVKTATLNGRTCGLKYDVTFAPHDNVFRLPRKCSRLVVKRWKHRARAIVNVRETDSVPVRCIQVGSQRGAYLITESFITTHNSSLGRLGLICHATAGFVDPGFKGTLTLEITNFNSVPIVLRPGLPIAQLSLMALDHPAQRPYGHVDLGSHYQGQRDATESRYEGGRATVPSPPESE